MISPPQWSILILILFIFIFVILLSDTLLCNLSCCYIHKDLVIPSTAPRTNEKIIGLMPNLLNKCVEHISRHIVSGGAPEWFA